MFSLNGFLIWSNQTNQSEVLCTHTEFQNILSDTCRENEKSPVSRDPVDIFSIWMRIWNDLFFASDPYVIIQKVRFSHLPADGFERNQHHWKEGLTVHLQIHFVVILSGWSVKIWQNVYIRSFSRTTVRIQTRIYQEELVETKMNSTKSQSNIFRGTGIEKSEVKGTVMIKKSP
jgi:hypothetical protein